LFVKRQPTIQLSPLRLRQRKPLGSSRDAVPDLFDESHALCDGELLDLFVGHARHRTILLLIQDRGNSVLSGAG
jgi:hypothetical protein